MNGDNAGVGNYEIAAAALGLLTATYHDDNHFGAVTMEYLAAMGSDTKQVIRLATGMTAVARLMIGMRDRSKLRGDTGRVGATDPGIVLRFRLDLRVVVSDRPPSSAPNNLLTGQDQS